MSRGPSILPPGAIMPPVGTVVGRVEIRLRMGGRFECESDIQDPRILCEMLRAAAKSFDRESNAGPGTVIVDHGKATFLEDAGKPGRL